MHKSSSTSNSDRETNGWLFCRRLTVFLLPLATLAILLYLTMIYSGEYLSVQQVARLQASGSPILYLPKLSDHTYRFKVDSARIRRPEVLVLGSSRSNQWRSRMFAPYSFYNGGNSVYTFGHCLRALKECAYPPKVLIFNIDFYMFHSQWDSGFEKVSFDDFGTEGTPERARIARGLAYQILKRPATLNPFPKEPLYRLPALGLSAAQEGQGYRKDGSLQYGTGTHGATLENALERVSKSLTPFYFGQDFDAARVRDFEELVKFGREKGVRMVGISMPYHPEILDRLNRSENHGHWQKFRQADFSKWVRSLGVDYYDLSSIESFAGVTEEFVDPFHASETAYIRILLRMCQELPFQSLLPELDQDQLRQHLEAATPHDAYRNEF